MLPAPSFEIMRETLQEKRTSMIGILFAPPFERVGSEDFVPRLGYLDEMSGQHIHFFCAGYGGYAFADDAIEICEMTYENGVKIPWGFSQRMFAKFVKEIEEKTLWEYSGRTDIILTSPSLDFDTSIEFDIDKMISDKAIDDAPSLFRVIINYARNNENISVSDFSDQGCGGVLVENAAGTFFDLLPKRLQAMWEEGKHYTTRSLRK